MEKANIGPATRTLGGPCAIFFTFGAAQKGKGAVRERGRRGERKKRKKKGKRKRG